MKRIILPLFALFFTLSSYSQYRVFYFVDALKGKKSTVKKLLTNEVKKANQVRIDKGVLKGYDIWEIIAVGGDGETDFIVVELYDQLENYHKHRGVTRNAELSKEESSRFWETWHSSTSGNGHSVILKVESFESKTNELPKMAKFNMYQTVSGEMRNKWIESHKKFSKQFINGKRDAWGSASVIMKPFNVKYNHITVDFYDNENLASFLLDNENRPGISDEMRDYWKKEDGTMPKWNIEVRKQVNGLITKNILQLK
ncbi:MAG: hypothetical protein CBC02_011070 [Flavobacteriaceae bacterium TMED42]|nr:MAG: hypothetical protein CBC02_011070 [Flavobacteriaceae bacterium TMED42]|tara:strand:- start:2032 stop:2799 length:768 start_codon:yes stop_codon:yes gene_type:complete